MAGVKGRSGGKKKPTEMKVIEGTFRKDRDGKQALSTKPISSLTPPKYLSGKYAKEVWKKYAPELNAIGVLRGIDELAFAAFCECTSEWMEAEKMKAAAGLIYETETESGAIMSRKSPLIEVANQAKRQMLSFMSEFGMTPASRSRLAINLKPESGNPFADL